jgi:hypothetical protein
MLTATIGTVPIPATDSYDPNFFCLFHTIGTKSKATVTTPGKSILSLTDKTRVKCFDGIFSGAHFLGLGIHAFISIKGC